MIEAPAAYRTDRNALFFIPGVAQGSERHPFLLPALRRAPKETLFCSLRCAGPRKTPFFASCVTQGSERDPFLLPASRRARKRPFFAPCVTQGPERHPFLLPAQRRAQKDALFASCATQGPKGDAFQSGANKKSVQTVAARTLSSMLSLKSKILMPVASWSGHTCQRSQQPWRHRRLRLPRCRPQSAACGSSVHRHSPA